MKRGKAAYLRQYLSLKLFPNPIFLKFETRILGITLRPLNPFVIRCVCLFHRIGNRAYNMCYPGTHIFPCMTGIHSGAYRIRAYIHNLNISSWSYRSPPLSFPKTMQVAVSTCCNRSCVQVENSFGRITGVQKLNI